MDSCSSTSKGGLDAVSSEPHRCQALTPLMLVRSSHTASIIWRILCFRVEEQSFCIADSSDPVGIPVFKGSGPRRGRTWDI